MAAPTCTKTPMERRIYPFHMAAQISQGAVLTSVQGFASRAAPPVGIFPLQATTLAALVTVGDTTIHLNADVKAGALLILEPSAGGEETLKVISTAPDSGHFVAIVIPGAWADHSNGAAVSYEPGVSARMLIDDTPTPSGTDVSLEAEKGAHGQSYRLSVVGTCNDGQVVEDELTLIVTDPTPEVTNIKQATETRDLAAEMDRLMEEPQQDGATITSATAFASSTTTITTTLAAQANAESTSISLVAHPGIGAMLILTPAGSGSNPREQVYVSNVTGAGPYTVTINPALEFTHSSGADVTVYTGGSANFLTSTTSSVAGKTVYNRGRRGAVGKTFKIVWLATTSQLERIQHSGFVAIQEI